MAKFAPRASYDASAQRRRSLMGKAHLSAKELGQMEDDRRAVLFRVVGKTSLADCSDAEIVAFLGEQERLGWKAQPTKKAGFSKAADHPAAMKARALWISLGHLGAIDDSSEAALEAFGRRQLKCERLQWANQGQMFKLIEALKAIALRHGWDATPPAHATNAAHGLKLVKVALLSAILVKLKAAGYANDRWNVSGAAIAICGFETAQHRGPMGWEMGDLDAIALSFGHLLRTGARRET